jgi:Phosphate-starvation-inducible E family
MGIKLFHLVRLMINGTDFSLVVGDILFVLVLLELFRLLLIYLDEHRVSVDSSKKTLSAQSRLAHRWSNSSSFGRCTAEI